MPSPESPLIEMASGSKASKKTESLPVGKLNSEKPQKTQKQLHESLQKRFGTLTTDIQANLDNYDQMLEDGTFEDKEGEESGSGDKRKELAQSKIEDLMNRAEKMKKTLDSKETLPQSTPQIEAQYTLTNPRTHAVERQETITLDIEKKTQEFINLYQKTGIDLPPDFTDTIQDIWQRNSPEIQSAIEQNGFDDILLVPGGISLTDLSEKLKMQNGYYEWIKSSGKTVTTLDGIPLTSQNTDKPRLVLVHKTQNLKDRPELAKTFNIKGQDLNLDQILTLEDYLIFQRKYFEETNKHLDEIGWTWLATKSGARLVCSYWVPGNGELNVNANDLDYRNENLGARPSRSFF